MTRLAYRLILIFAGAAGLFLIGNERVPLWDRDEPRYAQCSRQMLQSGDWVVPRFLDELRAHKPPLIYWCQATAMAVFGQTGAAARLPSSLAMLFVAALLAWFVRAHSDADRAVWSTVVFCTCVLTIAAAKLAITDAVLLLFIAVGQGCLFVIWRNEKVSPGPVLLFWLSMGMAGLTKGPVVLAMHAGLLAVLAVMDHWRSAAPWRQAFSWWRRIKPVVGLIILVAVVSPWLILVHQRAPAFLPRLLGRAARYTSSGAEGHARWPGFYLLIVWPALFPWCVFLPASIGTGVRHRQEPLLRFALAAVIGPWLVMELVVNKLPFYILPSFPALAVLTGEFLVRNHKMRTATWMAGTMAAVAAIVFAAVLPAIQELSTSRWIGRELNRLGAGGDTRVAMIDYREPSLAFYQGGGAREMDDAALTRRDAPPWAVMTIDQWRKLGAPVKQQYTVVDPPQKVLIYNDGWRITQLLIAHRTDQ